MASPAPTPTRPPPPLSAAADALLRRAHANFHAWVKTNPRVGERSLCALRVNNLNPSERRALMDTLVAGGYDVRDLAHDGDRPPGTVFFVERTMLATPPTTAVRVILDRVQGAFSEWISLTRDADRLFVREFSVDDLSPDERLALLHALKADGFAVREIAYDTDLPRNAFYVECAVPSFTSPKTEAEVTVSSPAATQLDDQARASAIVDEANRQFTQWLILTNCSPTSSFAMSVDLMGMPDSSRQLVKRLLRASEFQIAERGHDALHIHRLTSRAAV